MEVQLLLITAVCYYFVAWQVLALEEQLKREDIKREREGGRGRGGRSKDGERERENRSYSLIHYRVTYYTEFLPKKLRGACLVLIEVWWAIGSGLAALLALAVIPNGKITIT